jgi:ParB/RepB/Spo0J family partition protein
LAEIQELLLDSISNPTLNLRPVSQSAVDDLAKSIAGSGLLQPVMVRPDKSGYQLVFGLHRVLACRSLGWKKIPAFIKDLSDEEIVLLRIVENIQRNTSMNVLEEGKAYKSLMNRGWTVSRVSQAIGKSDSYVLDRVRMVDRLQPEIAEEATGNSHLTPSHAIRIAYIKDKNDQLELAHLVKTERLSVRQLEEIVAMYKSRSAGLSGLSDMVSRLKVFKLDHWSEIEGIFPGPDGRVAVLRAETFNRIVDGLGDQSLSVGIACGRTTLKLMSAGRQNQRSEKIRLLSLMKRVREFNIRSGWGVLGVKGGAVEFRNSVLTNAEFIRGYLEGLLSLNLKLVASSETDLLFRIVRR